MKSLTGTVWILSMVSLFTDTASEMLYPVMPVYLKSIGYSVLLIGILEGVAEATAGLSKGYFGRLSDISGRRTPFVQVGYALSAVTKPMMAFFTYPVWIFLVRATDRIGKGIRTGARDAILADETTPETRGKVFGFHRSMDTLGAVAGPALALIYLHYFPGAYKNLFYIAFIPGLLSIAATFLLKEKLVHPAAGKPAFSFRNAFSYWNESPLIYKKITAGLLLFSLFNSSDVFLLLKVREAGLSDEAVIGVYIFYNLVYALSAFPVGIIADKTGLKKMLVTGLCFFAGVYAGMVPDLGFNAYMFLFFLYGIYGAATEGISKALISNVTAKEARASAIGTFTGFQSICSLTASSVTGFVWYNAGSHVAFMLTAGITVLVIIYFILFVDYK